ncbi:hypothetical protein U1Q18_052372 [Sarracenia purpurea var. burkii]
MSYMNRFLPPNKLENLYLNITVSSRVFEINYRPFITNLQQHKRQWEDFLIASLLSGLDYDLHGFKDQILASETLHAASNAYSWLLCSLLGQFAGLPNFLLHHLHLHLPP